MAINNAAEKAEKETRVTRSRAKEKQPLTLYLLDHEEQRIIQKRRLQKRKRVFLLRSVKRYLRHWHEPFMTRLISAMAVGMCLGVLNIPSFFDGMQDVATFYKICTVVFAGVLLAPTDWVEWRCER